MQNEIVTALLNDLVSAHDTADRLELIDQQLKARTISGDSYIVPTPYHWMSPLIDAFWDKPKDWLNFIRAVSHRFPKRSARSMEIQSVKKRINTRVDAMIRRDREKRLIHSYELFFGPFESATQKDAYVKWVSSQWHERREALRRKLKSQTIGPIDADELYDAYSELWDEIDTEIADGTIPEDVSSEDDLIHPQNINYQALVTLAREARMKVVELGVAIAEYQEDNSVEKACFCKVKDSVSNLREIENFLLNLPS